VDPVCALDCSVVTSSREAQAEIKNVVAEKKTAKIARRFIIRVTNHQFRYLSNRFDWGASNPKIKSSLFDVRRAAGKFHHDEGG
jgi:hypothetical protein